MEDQNTTKKGIVFDTFGDSKSIVNQDEDVKEERKKKPSIFGNAEQVSASILKNTQKPDRQTAQEESEDVSGDELSIKDVNTTKKGMVFGTFGDGKSHIRTDLEKREQRKKKLSIFANAEQVNASVLQATKATQ